MPPAMIMITDHLESTKMRLLVFGGHKQDILIDKMIDYFFCPPYDRTI